nr:biotin carboxylase N-terminal domain-containing protein [Streptomyces sp. H51]
MSTRTAPLPRVLVADRGGTAVRLVSACHDLGIEAVAVHSAPGAEALRVRAGAGDPAEVAGRSGRPHRHRPGAG